MHEALPPIINTIIVIAAIIVTVFTLRTFLSFRKTSKTVYFATFVGYFCSIVLLFLIPLDIGVVCLFHRNSLGSFLDDFPDLFKCFIIESILQPNRSGNYG